jgi:hypothetical protein
MVGDLIMLPVRIGVGASRLWLRAAGQGVAVAANAATKLLDSATGRQSVSDGMGGPARPLPPERRARSVGVRAPAERVQEPPRPRPPSASDALGSAPPPAAPPRTPPEPEPPHVSEEPVLVDAFSEPGAEDGAGAELHVEEPWSGYDQMNAKQVVARLGEAGPAELAAVQLYESGHRARQTILTSVARELRTANGRGRRS